MADTGSPAEAQAQAVAKASVDMERAKQEFVNGDAVVLAAKLMAIIRAQHLAIEALATGSSTVALEHLKQSTAATQEVSRWAVGLIGMPGGADEK